MKQTAACLALSLCGSIGHAEDAMSIERPKLAVGASWQVRILDGLTKVQKSERTLTVASVSADGIQIGDQEGDLAYLLEPANLGIKAAGALEYEPAIERTPFPLAVGKRWEQAYTYVNPQCGKTQSRLSYHVAGWEDVQVPAGSFRALRIEANGQWRSSCGSDRMVQVFWVAAEHGMPIRQEVQNYFSGRLYSFDVTELVSAAKP